MSSSIKAEVSKIGAFAVLLVLGIGYLSSIGTQGRQTELMYLACK